jgi:L-rhamnose mutarotase
MIRKAFRMSVNAGDESEYERRHSPIWKELEELLVAHGVHTYSIFIDPQTRDLFAYAEIDSEERWTAIASTPVCRRWWQHMREIMPANPDNSPVSRDLREVFHLDNVSHTETSRVSK